MTFHFDLKNKLFKFIDYNKPNLLFQLTYFSNFFYFKSILYMNKTPLILIIEDEHNIRQDIVKILSLNKFQTIDTDDGNEAIRIARESLPNLIISDIMMPIMDGITIFKKLQEHNETATIPFLFLSAKSSKEDIRMGMNLGADDYITKPFDIQDLVNAVKSRISKQEKTLSTLNKRYDDLKQSLHRTIPHEIRTPLNTILGYSEYLIKNVGSNTLEKNTEMLEFIYSDAKRLQKMFENFIFLSKVEAYHSNPDDLRTLRNKKTIYSEMLIKDVFFYYANENKRVEDLEFDIIDADLQIHEEHFAKIIESIADNCFKFSKLNDKVLISSTIINEQLVISFKDFGIGIAANHISEVSAFRQFNRDKNEQQGNGLGLAIVKSLVHLYNGNFKIDSVESEYTNIIISLPIAR